jgi:hypothetical protein
MVVVPVGMAVFMVMLMPVVMVPVGMAVIMVMLMPMVMVPVGMAVFMVMFMPVVVIPVGVPVVVIVVPVWVPLSGFLSGFYDPDRISWFAASACFAHLSICFILQEEI